MDFVNLAAVVGSLAGAVVGVGAIVKFVVAPIRKLLRQQEEFRDDWFGRPARPGHAPIPGIPERLERIEGQLCPHTAGSLYATVRRLEDRLDHIVGGTA
jgi:hypothetical protein